MSVICSHCGQESRTSDRYCLHCGQLLDPKQLVSQNGREADAPPTAARATPAVGRLVLLGARGTDEPSREFALDGSEVSIGRAPTCDVVLPEDQVASRRHALLRFDGIRYSIEDLGSSNGTFVNDTEIHQPTALAEGDRITVGDHEIQYSRIAVPSQPRSLTTDGLPVPTPPPWPPVMPLPTETRAPAPEPMPETPPETPLASAPEPVGDDGPDHAMETVVAPAPPTAAPDMSIPEPALPDRDAIAAMDTVMTAPPVVSSPVAPDPSWDPDAPVRAEKTARRLRETAADDHPAGAVAQLRSQLVAVSEALAQYTTESERETEHLRAELADLSARAAQALAAIGAGGPSAAPGDASAPLDDLIQVANQAAENPRHLDYVTALAARSGDMAHALRVTHDLAAALEELRTRLAALAPTSAAES